MKDFSAIGSHEWYRCVKTDGRNFHCFLCVRSIFSVVEAEQHVADEEHFSKFLLSNCAAPHSTLLSKNEMASPSLRDRLKCNYVRSEDLHLWAVKGAELLDVDSDGEIFCLLCEDYVDITELPVHCDESSLHTDVKGAIIRLCDDIRTDGILFYCLRCNCELADWKRLKEHIVASTHASYYPEVRIGLLQNVYDLLFVQCDIKNFTADDLKNGRIIGENTFVEYVDVESDGHLYCLLCNRYLKFTVLSEHFDGNCGNGFSHKDVIDNINDNLLKYVRTLGGNGGAYFYCFLCSREMLSVNNVKLHVSSKNHAYRHLALQRPSSIFEFQLELFLSQSQYDCELLLFLDERRKFHTITKDDLSRLLVGHEDDFFDIADGRIRCEPCSEEYVSVSRFVAHCADSVDHRIGNAVYRLCAEIRLMSFESSATVCNDNDDSTNDNGTRFWFCCLKCACPIANPNILKTHIFAKPHRKQYAPDALIEERATIDLSVNFFVDRFPFKLITVDDLEQIVDDAHLLQFLNVNSRGHVYCLLCGKFVNIFDSHKPHFNGDLEHKKYVSRVQTLRDKIKLVNDGGPNTEFYCFVCLCKIRGRECLTEHVTRNCANRLEFKLMEFVYDWFVLERRIQFERVTKEDLKCIVGDADEMEFFELRSCSDDCNKIYCSLCELSLDIDILREHSGKNRKHRENVSAVRSLREHVKMVGDSYLFCFLCSGEIGNIGDVREHVRSRHRSSLVGLPGKAYELAWTPDRSKFRSITKEDLKRLTTDPPEYFDTRPDGTVYCSLCADVVTMIALREHCRSTKHLSILSHVNNYLYSKVKLIADIRQGGDEKRRYYYCQLCSCKIGTSLADLKEHIGVGGRHASIYDRSSTKNGHRLPDYVINDSFLRRLKFETNDFENELAIVRRLCEEIRVDRSESYYCLRCRCAITNGRPIEHVIGGNHLSKCSNVAKKSLTSVRHLLNEFSVQFETLSADDLPKMFQTNCHCFVVNTGQLYCQPCARPIYLIDANKHSLDLHTTHEKFIVERLCEDVRTVGVDRFYCFRCSCPLLSFTDAFEHVVGAQHFVPDCPLTVRTVKAVANFKRVTSEYLKRIVDDDVRFFDVDPNNGEICCKECNYANVNIGTLREHASAHKKASDKARRTGLIKEPKESTVKNCENLFKNHSHIRTDVDSGDGSSASSTRSKPTSITERNTEIVEIDLHENENSSCVRYLCETVVTDCCRCFYCICCSCAISGRKPAMEHITGLQHLSVLKVAQNKVSSVKKLLLNFLSSYQFRTVTDDDLRQILGGSVDWFAVVKDTGQVCCQICNELLPVTAVKKHAQRLSFHKTCHAKRIYNDIIISGSDQAYCIRCSESFSGIDKAASHAVSSKHAAKYRYTPPPLCPADVKKEYYKAIARGRGTVERYDAKSDLARRLCEVVIDCREHFYCLKCSATVYGGKNILAHIVGENHLNRFQIAKEIARELLRGSFFSSYQFRRITVDDLPLILKNPVKPKWLTVEVDTGRIFCDICKRPVSIYELKEHARHVVVKDVAVKSVTDDIKKPVVNGDNAYKTLCRQPKHVDPRDFKQRVATATADIAAAAATTEKAVNSVVNRVNNGLSANAIKHDAENCRENANPSNRGDDIDRLCQAIITANCHSQFYCLSCFCEITGEKNVLQHVTGKTHLSCSQLAKGDFKYTKEQLHGALSSYKFRQVTADNLQLISKTKKTAWLTVIPGTGQILCNVCKQPIGKQRAKRSSPIIDDIRMVGADRLYCFRCCCLLSSTSKAVSHAIKAQHISSDSQLRVENYKFKCVTTEQLKLIVNEEAKCFGIDPSNGRIYCSVCRYDVTITHLTSHINNHVHRRTKICRQLCENVCRIAESNNYFYCSLCVLKIFSLNNARQHVLSTEHMAHFYRFNEITKKRNEYMSLWDHFEFK